MQAQIIAIPKSQLKVAKPTAENDKQQKQMKEKDSQNWDTIIQFGWNMQEQFKLLSIQGAIYIDCIQIENPPKWLLKSQAQLLQYFSNVLSCRNKKTQKQRILVYNRCVKQNSIIPACRIALLLLHLNIYQQIDILVEGLQGFIENKQPYFQVIRVKKLTDLSSKSNYDCKLQKNPIILSKQQFKERIQKSQILDVRTRAQFQGNISGYDYHELKGNIPGSIYHGGTLSTTNNQAKQYQLNGQFLDMWKSQGIQLQQPIILYCGTGWRASKVMVYAILHKITSISLYSNGWIQWSLSGEPITQLSKVIEKTQTSTQQAANETQQPLKIIQKQSKQCFKKSQ